MPLDMSIYQSLLRPPKTVAEYDAEAVQGQTNRLALQAGQAQLQDRQRAIDDGNRLRQTVSGFGADQTANYNALLSSGNLKAAQDYQKANADVTKTGAETAHLAGQTQKDQFGVIVQANGLVGSAAGAIMQNPDYNHAVGVIGELKQKLGPELSQKLGLDTLQVPQDPAQLKAWANDHYLQSIDTDKQLADARAKSEGAANRSNQVLTTGMNNATQIKTTGMNNATQVRTTGMNNSTQLQVQDKITARQPEPVSGTKLAPEDITTMAQQYIAGDKSVLQGLGRGTQGAEDIRAVRAEIGKQLRGSNLTGADQAAKIAEYAGMTAGMRATGNISARVENAVEEAAQLAPLALAASKDVARSGLLPFGKAQIMFDTNTNDPNLAKFATANMGLATAYASAMARGNKPTVSDMEHARGLLSTAKSQPAYEATVQQMMQEMQAAKRAPRSVRGSLSREMSGRSESEAPATSSAGKPSLSDIFGK